MVLSSRSNTRKLFWLLLAIFVCLPVFSACDDYTAATIDPDATDGDGSDGDTDGEPDVDSDGDGDADGDESDGDSDSEGLTDLLWLDEALDEGDVRGGIIRRETELVSGPEATGRIDDYKLYNARVAFIIAAAGPGRGFATYGGSILDAVRMNADGNWSADYLVDAAPFSGHFPTSIPFDGTLRQIKVEEASQIELIHNGSDGQPAHLRVTGADWPIQMVDEQLLVALNPQVDITVDYRLSADDDFLRITVTVALDDTADPFLTEPFRPGLAVLTSDTLTPFMPGMEPAGLPAPSLNKPIHTREPLYAAFYGDPLAYFVSGYEPDGILAQIFPTDVLFAMDSRDLIASQDESPSGNLIFGIAANSPESAYRIAHAHHLAVDSEAADDPGTVSGTLALMSEFGDTRVEVLATGIEYIDDDEDKPREYIQALTWMGADDALELSLPQGDWSLFTRNQWGELSDPLPVSVSAGQPLEAGALNPPPRPALVTVAVLERPANGADDDPSPVSARVDIFDGELDIQPGFTLPEGMEPLATVITHEGETSVTVPVPHGGGDARPFTFVASRGSFYTIATAVADIQTGLGPGETQGAELIIERVVDPGMDLPSGTQRYLHPVDLLVRSERSLTSQIVQSDRLWQAAAEGLEMIVAADLATVTDYTSALDETGLTELVHPVFVFPGLTVAPTWSQFSGLNVGVPAEAAAYFDIPVISYSPTGSANGRRVAPDIQADLSADDGYAASLVQINRPRGPEDSDGFFDFFGDGSDGDPAPYDPHTGISSLRLEVRNTLEEWQTLEGLSGAMAFADTYSTLQDWFSLLSQGIFKPLTGSSNLDGSSTAGFGWARTLILSDQQYLNKTRAEALFGELAAGHAIVTGGPTLHVSLGDALPGDTYTIADPSEADVRLDVALKLQAPAWMSVRHLYVCINGNRMDSTYEYIPNTTEAVRFDGNMTIRLPRQENGDTPPYQDSWLVAMAFGRDIHPLDPLYPGKPSFAISNPIFVEADGQEGYSGPPLTGEGESFRPYCISENLCDFFAAYEEDRPTATALDECCALFPDKAYCQ